MGMATDVVDSGDLLQQMATAIANHRALTDRLKSLVGDNDQEEKEQPSEDGEVS